MGRRRRKHAASDAEWNLLEAAGPSAPAPPDGTAHPTENIRAPALATSAHAPPSPIPSPTSRFLRALPSELLPRILSLLPPNDLAGSVRLVCRDALDACHETLLMHHAALMPSVGATLPAPLCCCTPARTRPHHLAVPTAAAQPPCTAANPPGTADAASVCSSSSSSSSAFMQQGLGSISSNASEGCPLCPRFTIHLSQPVPPALFAWRWAPRDATNNLTYKQCEQLWRLTVATGVLQNVRVLRCRTVWYGDPEIWQTSADFTAAARSGSVELVRHLRRTGHREDREAALQAAAAAGRTEVCYWLLRTQSAKMQWPPFLRNGMRWAAGQEAWDDEIEDDTGEGSYGLWFTGWTMDLPGLAAAGGHAALVQWLLQVHDILFGPNNALYPVDAHCVLEGAAFGCSVGLLTTLYGTFTATMPRLFRYDWDRERTAHAMLLASATSTTPDWQAKAAWVLGEFFDPIPGPSGAAVRPGHSNAVRGTAAAAAAAAAQRQAAGPGGGSGCSSSSSSLAPSPGGKLTPQSEVCTAVTALPGALPRLQWLQERGCPLDPPALLQQVVCVSGDADVLTHLLQHHEMVPGPQEVQRAACLGHVAVLQVLLRNHPYGRGTVGSGGEDEEMRDLFRRAVLSAAWCGQVHVLAWLARARRELVPPPPPPSSSQQQQTASMAAAGDSAGGGSGTDAPAAAAAAVFPTAQEVLSATLWDDAIGCDPTQQPLVNDWERRVSRRAGKGRREPPGLGLPEVWQGGEWWKVGSGGAGGGGDGFMAGYRTSVHDLRPPFHEHPLYSSLPQRHRQQLQQRLVLLRQKPEQRVLRTLLWLRHEGTWWPGAPGEVLQPGEVLLQRTWRAPNSTVEWLRGQGVRVERYEAYPPAGGGDSGSEEDEEGEAEGHNAWVSQVRCSAVVIILAATCCCV